MESPRRLGDSWTAGSCLIFAILFFWADQRILDAFEPGDPVPENFTMPDSLSPEVSLGKFEINPDLQVELVAAEPLVMDPINIDWGPDGKLWVVEMAGYPEGIGPGQRAGGRVRYLEDTDGDGSYDKSTLFLDGLNYPNSVKSWGKGVIVTSAPEIFYAEDSDGDGKADKREILFKGFQVGNPQHQVNGLKWGLDNWLYLANGHSGGRILSVKTGGTFELGKKDLRIRPDTGEFDLQAGRSQYGRARDDWGNWFGNNNTQPVFHYILPDHYLRRNPYVFYPSSVVMVPKEPYSPRVFPTGLAAARLNNAASAGRITSACSTMIYRDHRLGSVYYGNSFTCEPAHNLVYRQVLAGKGLSFAGNRAKEELSSDFLTSSDLWFRPTAVLTGPDGALWIVDMYRYVIEHPKWIPEQWKKVINLRAGEDRGRIYRITSKETEKKAAPHRLDRLKSPELVSLFDSPNGWVRDMAQQILIWRKEGSIRRLLEKKVLHSGNSLTRLHALCTLDGLGELTPRIIIEVLNDKEPRVRLHAVRLSEPFAGTDGNLLQGLKKLASDSDPRVRFQLAFTLGEWKESAAGKTLGELALRQSGNPSLIAATTSSLPKHLGEVMNVLLGSGSLSKNLTSMDSFLPSLMGTAVGMRNEKTIARLLELYSTRSPDTSSISRFGAFAELLEALDRGKKSYDQFTSESGPRLKNLLGGVGNLMKTARKLVKDDKAEDRRRISAIALMGRIEGERQKDLNLLIDLLLTDLIDGKTPTELQSSAIRRIGRIRPTSLLSLFRDRWKVLSPLIRRTILDELLSRRGTVRSLLASIEKGNISPSALDAAAISRLQHYENYPIQSRARHIFGNPATRSRAKVLERYKKALPRVGNAERGQVHFKTFCSACHKLGGIGRRVGPDLVSLKDISRESLLIAIIDPNRAVANKYKMYEFRLNDGRSIAGMVKEESGNSLTFQGIDGGERMILRNQILSVRSSGLSLMPDGLDAALNPRKMADLIAFIQDSVKNE